MSPKRLQRTRKKGDRLPPGTVCVTRPSKWGNPFRPYTTITLPASEIGLAACHGPIAIDVGDVDNALAWYRIHLRAMRLMYERAGLDYFETIRGKNLACWCAIGSPCHADILLEMANQPTKYAKGAK